MKRPYPICPEFLPDQVDLRSGHYLISFARTPRELEEVQRLRFEIFNVEMGEGLDESYKTRMDVDPFDDHCHHLLVRDTRNGELVGTYRMQNGKMAACGNGFYSDAEYHLNQLPAELLEQSLELGRACISVDHRNGRVLFLLWRGLLYYLQYNKLRYMFGCSSLTSQVPVEGWALYARLKRSGSLHPHLSVPPRDAYRCPERKPSEEDIAGMIMPRLMRLYLDYGARVCSGPAIDRAFKTIDYLILFDLRDIPEKLMKTFRKDLS